MKRLETWRAGLVLALLLGIVGGSTWGAGPAWPRWRGPQGDGHSSETSLPTKWSTASVAWSVDLPGIGQSSPIVWGEKIFLTSSLEKGQKRVVLCVDRQTKKVAWQHTAWTGPPGPSHSMNGWASATCTTDGQRVYAFFGEGGGVHCYTVDGKPLWEKQIGVYDNKWGSASCPVLVGDTLIQLVDSDNNAFITGLDRLSGKELWKTKRENFRGWSTPVLVQAGGRAELVVNGHAAVCAYNPLTGKELWRCKNSGGRGTPSVTPGHGMLFVSNGVRAMLYAVKPGGNGDVSQTQVAWKTDRKSRDIPSPIVLDDYVLIVSLRGGILGCYEAKTGKELWKERLGTNFSASPVAWKGLAFFLNESGETFVVKPGPKYQVVARNKIEAPAEELFRASISPCDGQLFVRSTKKLYCFGARGGAGR